MNHKFQSTPPAKAETWSGFKRPERQRFQSTPPAKAETKTQERLIGAGNDFNPLHPRRRRQGCTGVQAGSVQISIHSTREGGDWTLLILWTWLQHFNPLHPRRRRPCFPSSCCDIAKFQSTPPAKAETRSNVPVSGNCSNFNPLHPRRRRQLLNYVGGPTFLISIHSTREGGDN